jgi:large subunit ribosomal protein L5
VLKNNHKSIVDDFLKEFGEKNIFKVPKLEKIVLNVGAGEAVHNSKCLEYIQNDLRLIAAQKPVVTKAKKSIAGFKLREGMPIGVKVTLRQQKMYSFLERLVNVCVPRLKDFKGFPLQGFDNMGNYTLGLQEQLIFPEIIYDNIDKVRGLSISFVTTTNKKEQALFLFKKLGLPFRKENG